MGRHKRISPVGHLRLAYSRVYDKDKEYALNFEYSWGKEIIRKDTGLRVKVSEWNAPRQELRTSFRHAAEENNRLRRILDKYDEDLRTFAEKYPDSMSSEVVKAVLRGEDINRDDGGRDFIEFVKEVLDSRLVRGMISKSRVENGNSSLNIFREFLITQNKSTYKEGCIYLGEISAQIIEDYICYRREVKRNGDATINHALTPIIQACEEAKDRGYITPETYSRIKQCRIVERPNLETEDDDCKFLTKEQIMSVLEFYNSDTEKSAGNTLKCGCSHFTVADFVWLM